METAVSVCLGLALAAACGFRVFVPFLVVNLAARAGWLELGGSFEWLGSTPALVVFGVATLLEIGAYYIPWLDHALDSIASPAAVVAGIVMTASVVTGIDPLLKWSLALVAGGGLAGAVQLGTSGARGASTWLTAGLGNPVVATAEMAGSAGLSVLAVVVPVLALVLALVLLALIAIVRRRRRRHRQRATAS